jgi:hypothetical protein
MGQGGTDAVNSIEKADQHRTYASSKVFSALQQVLVWAAALRRWVSYPTARR